VPELQGLRVGDSMAINKVVSYQVLAVNRPTQLIMAVGRGTDGKPAKVGSPECVGVSTWQWIVTPVDANTSRLILRSRSGGTSQGAFVDWLYDNPLDFGGAVMAYKTLAGIRDTAETIASGR
jgi:hypothetical protein